MYSLIKSDITCCQPEVEPAPPEEAEEYEEDSIEEEEEEEEDEFEDQVDIPPSNDRHLKVMTMHPLPFTILGSVLVLL